MFRRSHARQVSALRFARSRAFAALACACASLSTLAVPHSASAARPAHSEPAQNHLLVQRDRIERESERIQEFCDQYRASLKESFLREVVGPVKEDLDGVLRHMSSEEYRKLNLNVEAAWSGNPGQRASSLTEAENSLRAILARSREPMKSEVRLLRHDSAPVLPWLLASRRNVGWVDGKRYRVNVTFHGLPNDREYIEKLAVTEEGSPLRDVPQSTPLQPIIEKALPYACATLPTRQELNAFYAVDLGKPATDEVADLKDAGRMLSELSGVKPGQGSAHISTRAGKPATLEDSVDSRRGSESGGTTKASAIY